MLKTAAELLAAEVSNDVPKSAQKSARFSNDESAFTIANRVDTRSVLDRLGISYGEKFAVCPGCGEDGALICADGGIKCLHQRCAHVGPSAHKGFRTNVDMVAEKEQRTPLEAAKLVCEWFNLELPKAPTKKRDDAEPTDEAEWNPSDADNPQAPSPRKPPVWPSCDVAGIFSRLEPVNYLIEPLDLCAGAPALVAGYGFSGKTVALQSAAISIASGQRVWGAFTARRGRVLHVDYEQGSRLTRERYQRLAAGMMVTPQELAGNLELVSLPNVYLDNPALEPFFVDKFRGFDLAIVDSLRAAGPSLEENDSAVRGVLDMLNRVSEQTGCCCVVIHHARKPSQNQGGGGAKMAIRGSGAIFDACSSVLILEAEKGQPTRVSHEKARTSGICSDDFVLRIEDMEIGNDLRGGLVVTAETCQPKETANATFRALMKRIVDDLAANGPAASKSALAARIKGKVSDKFAAIDQLVADRKILVDGKNHRLATA